MSLATRCAACGTVFRVVQDQLKVSEGWVRCGRCGDVFNALEGLFDLDREAPPEWSPSQRARLAEQARSAQDDASITSAALEPPVDAQPDGAMPSPAATPGDDTVFGDGDTQALDTRTDLVVAAQSERDDDLLSDTDELPGALAGDDDAPVDEPVAPTPGFVRQAEHAERWQRPGMRLALAALAIGLAVLLTLLVALFDRDALAARWPGAVPSLTALCAPLDCRIEPLRRLGHLAVESSGLTKLEAVPLYRLSVALRNRGNLPVMPPAIELTLTDSRGAVVMRKVLAPGDLGVTQPSLAPGGEFALQGVLDVGAHRVAGYSVELFYP